MQRLCKMFVLRVLLLLVLSPALAAQTGSVFTVKGKDFFEKSRFVFNGKVVEKESFWRNNVIFTRYVFEVEEVIKGASTRRLDLVEYGGTVDGTTLTVSHQPHYALGQEYLVFSYIDLLGHNRTLAGPLGQFPILLERGGKRDVRVYASHPILEFLGNSKNEAFRDLRIFSRQIRQALENLNHAAR